MNNKRRKKPESKLGDQRVPTSSETPQASWPFSSECFELGCAFGGRGVGTDSEKNKNIVKGDKTLREIVLANNNAPTGFHAGKLAEVSDWGYVNIFK